jgi:hypothetical protein
MDKMTRADAFSNVQPISLPTHVSPMLLVVVDTEEEFDWDEPFSGANTATETLPCQTAAQAIMDRYGLIPTYVVDYPVAVSPAFRVLREFKDSGRCQIGAHLHPWVCPPHEETINSFNSYHGNLSPGLERAKLVRLTEAVTSAAGERPIHYKAGRHGIGPHTPAILAELGYKIDFSLVPHSDFCADGGPDFRGQHDRPFWFGPGGSLLEIPTSRGFVGLARRSGPVLYPLLFSNVLRPFRAAGIAARTRVIERISLTPEGFTTDEQRRLLRAMLEIGHRVFTLTYHSPSLAAGHTPYVRSAEDLTSFLQGLESIVRYFLEDLHGVPATPFDVLRLAEAARQRS